MSEPTDTKESETNDALDLMATPMAASGGARPEDKVKTVDMRVPMTHVQRPFDRETHGKDDVIDVHYDGVSWCIEDSSLDKDLEFTHLADAEARASDLSKSTGRSVCVHGQDGELIDSFKSKR